MRFRSDPAAIRGSIAPVVSPFAADGAADLDGLRNLIRWQLESGSHGISLGGSTGGWQPPFVIGYGCEAQLRTDPTAIKPGQTATLKFRLKATSPVATLTALYESWSNSTWIIRFSLMASNRARCMSCQTSRAALLSLWFSMKSLIRGKTTIASEPTIRMTATRLARVNPFPAFVAIG